MRSSSKRRWRGGAASRMAPPPMVMRGEKVRTTKRSRATATAGRSSANCTVTVSPGATRSRSSSVTRAMTSSVPRCSRTRARCLSSSAEGNRKSWASSRVVGCSDPGAPAVWPRRRSSFFRSGTFSAVRRPVHERGSFCPCTCTPRTRAVSPSGNTSTWSPTCTCPDSTVPAITVPKPCMVNTRSTGMRNTPLSWRGVTCLARSVSARRSVSIPACVTADTGMMGASARKLSATKALVCSVTTCSRASSTRSAFVRATSPCRTPSRRRMSRCSRVWAATPSSAAMTSMAASRLAAPATIVRTSRSWPGTSMKTIWAVGAPPSCWRAGGMNTNPNSIVIPRRFSSSSVSASTPVNAFTSAVLPWSMCPAVPVMTCCR